MASTTEIWLVDFGPAEPEEAGGVRPGLVVGPPGTMRAAPFVFVAPITKKRRGLATHVEVESGPATGLDITSYVQCEKTRSVSRRRLIHRLGLIGPDVRHAVARRLGVLIDI